MKRRTARGFTLVELLVVIAIIAILAVIVAVVINPIELRKRSNDAARLSDLANLQQSINIAAQEATNSGSEILCVGGMTGTPAHCSGDSRTGTRASDGTGWVKVNLGTQKAVSMPTLPVDPINDTTYLYRYYSDGNGWEINAKLESDQQKAKMESDGGNSNDISGTTPVGWYEVGSNLQLMGD